MIAQRVSSLNAGILLGLTLLFCWPMFYNGFPLVYGDTGNYVGSGIERYLPQDRPIFYGLFLGIGFSLGGIYSAILLQSLCVAYTISLFFSWMAPDVSRSARTLSLVLLALVTPVSWLASWLIPDVFGGLIVLVVILFVFAFDALRLRHRLCLGLILALALIAHSGNVLLIACLLPATFLLGILFGHRPNWRGAWFAVAIGVFSIFLVLVSNVVAFDRWTINPGAQMFTTARLVADGYMKQFLERHCPTEPTLPLCDHVEELDGMNHEKFLWDEPSLATITGGWSTNARAYEELNSRVISEHSGSILGSAIQRSLELLIHTHFSELSELNSNADRQKFVTRIIEKFFPGEFPRFLAARQQTGELHLLFVNRLHFWSAWLSYVLLFVVAVRAFLNKDTKALTVVAVMATAFVLNAFVHGSLSGVHPRYQLKVTWLATLVSLAIMINIPHKLDVSPTHRRRRFLVPISVDYREREEGHVMAHWPRPAHFLAANWPILALTVVLTFAVVIVSPKKPFWNDELFSWYVLTASFDTNWRAFNDAINNTPFLYFGLGWLWVQVFGASELSLRLFSSVGISVAAFALWPILRRTFGFWPATLALLGTFCTAGLVLDQNTEARMYGLFLAMVALAVPLYDRVLRTKKPTPTMIGLNALVHAAIVHTHLFGLFYSGAFAAAFAASRLLESGFSLRRLLLSLPVYLSFLAAWLSFLLYLPAFFAQAEAGRPYSWIAQPSFMDLWMLLSLGSGALLRSEVLGLLIVVAGFTRLLEREGRTSSTAEVGRNDQNLIALAVALIILPVAVWIASRLGRPIFLDRYLIPSILGWSLLVAYTAARLLRIPNARNYLPRLGQTLILGATALGLLAFPIQNASVHPAWSPPGSDDPAGDLPIVILTTHGFLERIHYSRNPSRYFHILDWESTNTPTSGRFGIQQYKHMEAWRRVFPDIFGDRIVQSDAFLATNSEFLVVTDVDYRLTCDERPTRILCPQWVARRIANNPAYTISEFPSSGNQGEVLLYVRRIMW
jgi:hypothetical protein